MSIASEITRLQTSKADSKAQINIDKDIINDGIDFINNEKVDSYDEKIAEMQEAYKQYIPINSTSDTQIEAPKGGVIIGKTIKGNTLQDGTPTPNSPVPVNNVTGLQTITISNGTNSKDYEINLGNIELNKIGNYQDFIRKGTGKNLLNTNKMLYGTISQADGITISDNSSVLYSPQYIEVKPNTKYTLSCKVAGITIRLFNYEDYETYINTSIASTSNTTTSFTTSSNTYFIRLQYNQSFNIDMQLEDGSFTYYEPYNYGGKWYIEKNVGKVVLDGSRNWTKSGNTNIDRFVLSGYVDYGDINCFSNYFDNGIYGDTNYTKNQIFLNTYSSTKRIIVNYSTVGTTTLAQFKTWLSTHNTIVYYVLSSPTFEIISDSTLISQLNENIYLFEGQNNISVSGNLPTGIDVDYIERVNKHLIGNINNSFNDSFNE